MHLFTLGRADEALKLEKDLTGRIAAVAGLIPRVQVIGVADSTALENVFAKLDTTRSPAPVIAKTPSLDQARSELHEVFIDAWRTSAGKLLDTRISFPREALMVLEVVHLGPQLGPAGEELLGDRISRALGSEMELRDVAISPEPILEQRGEGSAFLNAAWPLLQHVRHVPGLRACLEFPAAQSAETTKGKSPKEALSKSKRSKDTGSEERHDSGIAELLRTSFTKESDRIEWRDGETWRLLMTTEACAASKTPEAEGAKAFGANP